MSYASVLAAVFVLWPVMGVLGGQGYAPLLALAALPALAMSRPKWPPASYAVLACLLVVWAAISETWSPHSTGLTTGSLLEGDFAIKATSLRVVLTAVFGLLAAGGALRIAEGGAQISSRVMLGGFAVHGLLLSVSAIFAGPLVHAIYGSDPQRVNEGMQNIARSANAFVLVLPVLVSYLAMRPGRAWKLAVALMVAVSLLVFARADSETALMGTVFMFVTMGIIHALPKTGFRVLLTVYAAYIAAAPMLIGTGLRLMNAYGITLPPSSQSRAWSWHMTIEKISERPLTGHGIAASKTWSDTYADHPDWMARVPDGWANYQVVPGHVHNMALQLWAETGLIGAVLAGFALVLLGFRLPPPSAMREDVRYAAAGFAGAALSLFSFSYNLWNEAFWSTLILVAIGIILLAKRQRSSL